MSGMTITQIIHQAQNLGAYWVRHALEHPAAVLGAPVKWGRSRQETNTTAQAVTRGIDTAAEKAKLPRGTRKRTAKALKPAARELRHPSPSQQRNKKKWLLGGVLATAALAGTIAITGTLRARRCPEPLGTIASPPDPLDGPAETPAKNTNSLDQTILGKEEPPG